MVEAFFADGHELYRGYVQVGISEKLFKLMILSNKLTTFRDKICGYDYAKLYCFKRMQEGKSKKGWC